MSRSLKVLGIETATHRSEIALALDHQVVTGKHLPENSKPTATLVPAIRAICREAGWSPRELDVVAVDVGPGSYTGLRVGLTCAKTFAYAAGASLATAHSLEVVASNAPADESVVEVVFDAARGQLFVCRFRRDSDSWRPLQETRVVDADEWIRGLGDEPLVLGPGLANYRERIPVGVRVADEPRWWPRADQVIRVGLCQFRSTPLLDYFTLEPTYLRPSAAEQKRAARRSEPG